MPFEARSAVLWAYRSFPWAIAGTRWNGMAFFGLTRPVHQLSEGVNGIPEP
ncbi:MAG: DUF2924 domain-containing protein [Acidobacteriota bacterium]|nr:DUF2924 domain-containing protein [Acidobacteriota bacterium]